MRMRINDKKVRYKWERKQRRRNMRKRGKDKDTWLKKEMKENKDT